MPYPLARPSQGAARDAHCGCQLRRDARQREEPQQSSTPCRGSLFPIRPASCMRRGVVPTAQRDDGGGRPPPRRETRSYRSCTDLARRGILWQWTSMRTARVGTASGGCCRRQTPYVVVLSSSYSDRPEPSPLLKKADRAPVRASTYTRNFWSSGTVIRRLKRRLQSAFRSRAAPPREVNSANLGVALEKRCLRLF